MKIKTVPEGDDGAKTPEIFSPAIASLLDLSCLDDSHQTV